MLIKVTTPVVVLKAPINELYVFGSTNYCLRRAFHETSTMLIDMPYPITSIARLRMYFDDAKYLIEY